MEKKQMRVTQYRTMFDDDKLPQLVEEKAYNYEECLMSSPHNVEKMMKDVFQLHKQTEEYFYLICVDSQYKPTGVFEISLGTAERTFGGPREFFQKALMVGATQIFVIHNHPSGSSQPSPADNRLAERLKEAGLLMGVNLVDFLILGEQIYSYKENGIAGF